MQEVDLYERLVLIKWWTTIRSCISLSQVSKRGGKPHDRMFFLFSDILIYGKPRLLDSINSSYTCCCVLPLKHCELETVFGGTKRGTQEKAEAGGMFKVRYWTACIDKTFTCFLRHWVIRISQSTCIKMNLPVFLEALIHGFGIYYPHWYILIKV